MKSRIIRTLDAMSAAGNCLFFNGDPAESISGRSWRCGWTWRRRIIDVLFFFNRNHCYRSHLSDVHSAQKLIDRSI